MCIYIYTYIYTYMSIIHIHTSVSLFICIVLTLGYLDPKGTRPMDSASSHILDLYPQLGHVPTSLSAGSFLSVALQKIVQALCQGDSKVMPASDYPPGNYTVQNLLQYGNAVCEKGLEKLDMGSIGFCNSNCNHDVWYILNIPAGPNGPK